MTDAELIEYVENPLVRAFLHEHLDEFVGDVLIFSEQVLAHVPPENKSFIKSAGLTFYSTPIVSFMPDLPWQTIKTAITNAVSEVFQMKIGDYVDTEKTDPDSFDKDHTESGFIKQVIVGCFASICKTVEDAMGAILIGGIAHLLGKYIALYIAGIIDEAVELKSWPIVQAPSNEPFKTRRKDQLV